MEDLIIHANILYDHPTTEREIPQSNIPPQPKSPPLPPTPAGEPVPPVTYGSKSTKTAIIHPEPTKADARSVSPPQDFNPRLPPRPNNSIHPSSRIATSPSKSKSHPEKPLPLIVPEQEELQLHQKLTSSRSTSSSSLSSSSSTSPPVSAVERRQRNSVTFPTQPELVAAIPSEAPAQESASVGESNVPVERITKATDSNAK